MTRQGNGSSAVSAERDALALVQAVLQTVPDPLWIVNAELDVTHGNAVFVRLCERALRVPPLFPMPLDGLLDPQRHAAANVWWRDLARRALAGRSVIADARIVIDGSQRTFSIAMNPVAGGAVCIARDVTDMARHEREDQFELAVTRLFDAGKPLADTLTEALEFLGEADEWDCAVAWLPEGDALVAGAFWSRESIDAAKFRERIGTLRFTRGHGIPGRAWASDEVLWISDLLDESSALRVEAAARAGLHGAVAMPLRDGARFVGVLELLTRAVRPMSEQRKRALVRASSALGRLIERRSLLEMIERKGVEWALTFDAIELPVFITRLDGTLVRLNRAALGLTGARDYAEVLETNLIDRGDREPWTTLAQTVEAVRDSRTPCTAQIVDEEGRTWDVNATFFDWSDSRRRPAGPPGDERAIVVLRDTTILVRLEESVRRGEQLAALGELVAGVAHEVRNPIFGMGLTLDALSASLPDTEDVRELSRGLRTWLDRLNRLMESLLEYGKTWSLELDAGTIDTVINHALEGCRPLAQQNGVELGVTVEGGLPLLMDANRLSHAFENLIINSVQHSKSGQRVFIDARADGDDIVCSVRDEGPGFHAPDLPRIFQPFFTKRRGGTGLGLSIVQRIVDEHGGTIVAANQPHGGAVVTMRFPAYRRESLR